MSRPDSPPPYGTVVFDCDSTLSAIEGIDELSGEHRAEIAALTERSMTGELPLDRVYGARLAVVRPRAEAVQALGRLYVERALPGARALVAALQSLGKRVAVVSGGLLPAVRQLADSLGIDADLVHAVEIRHDPRGAYRGFDEQSPLTRAGGKIGVLRGIAALPDAGPVVLVGDGATDLEAAGECARFVAFGGVQRREAVFAAAAVTCEAADLAALAPLLLSDGELASLAAHPEHGVFARRALARP